MQKPTINLFAPPLIAAHIIRTIPSLPNDELDELPNTIKESISVAMKSFKVGKLVGSGQKGTSGGTSPLRSSNEEGIGGRSMSLGRDDGPATESVDFGTRALAYSKVPARS